MPRLNVFLYRITPNIGYYNLDLPTRDTTTGQLIQRQKLGLNLDYLLTDYASDNDDIISQKLLGSAMRVLNERSILDRDTINQTIASAQDGTKITGSDLTNQVELVKLTLNNDL